VTAGNIDTVDKKITLTVGYTSDNTVSLAPSSVTDVDFTYAETTDSGNNFTIGADGTVTLKTGLAAASYTGTFTITATGHDTMTGTATKDITVTATVNAEG
jgi:hypothetical protein